MTRHPSLGALLVAAVFASSLACASKVENSSAAVDSGDSGALPVDASIDAATETTVDDADADTAAAYPAGPYGILLGQVFPDLEWDGYRDAAGDWTKLHMHDYYDPDGKLGIRGLLLDITSGDNSGWCGWCEEWSGNLAKWNGKIRERGGRLLEVLLGDSPVPSTVADQAMTDLWIKKRKLDFDVVVDRKRLSTTEDGKDLIKGIPRLVVIDTRTMKVAAIVVGLDGGVRYPCKDSTECCKVGGSRPGIDRQGSSGTGDPFCTTVDYVCSTTYASTCVNPEKRSPVPELETVLVANGAPAL